MAEFEPVTLGEAQFLLGRPQEEMNRAIDRGEVDKIVDTVLVPAMPANKRRARKPAVRGPRRRGSRVFGYAPPAMVRKKVRKLGVRELLFFAIENQVRDTLTPAGRKKLYAALKAQAPDARVVELGPLRIELSDARKKLADRVKELKAVRAGIVAPPGGDPVIRGTDISVYRVAALAESLDVAQILEDYPGLSERKITRAIGYAQAYPKLGRPYPATSFKRAVGALADRGVFDVPGEGGDENGAAA